MQFVHLDIRHLVFFLLTSYAYAFLIEANDELIRHPVKKLTSPSDSASSFTLYTIKIAKPPKFDLRNFCTSPTIWEERHYQGFSELNTLIFHPDKLLCVAVSFKNGDRMALAKKIQNKCRRAMSQVSFVGGKLQIL